MLQKEIKYFAEKGESGGRLNSDDAAFIVGTNEWNNLENIRSGSTDTGVTGTLESIGSNVLISQPQPSVTFITIGSIEDIANARIIKFNYNTTGVQHKIIALYTNTNIEYNVLFSSQITGGLNFSKNKLIHSVRIENGLLYWTDNYNEPKRINIEASINLNHPNTFPNVVAYVTPIAQSTILWIRRPPGLPPVQEKVTQSSPILVNNFIQQEAFQFCFRYIYRDYEISVLSSLSLLANYNKEDDTFNRINVNLPFGERIEQDVQQIDLIAKYFNSGVYFIVNSWNKDVPTDAAAIINHNSNISALTYAFYNDQVGIALDAEYSVKPFDSLPIYAQTIELARFRAFMANYTIGYDTPITTSLTATPFTGTGVTIIGEWYFINFESLYTDPNTGDPINGFYQLYILNITGLAANNGWYASTSSHPLPSTIDFTTLFYGGIDITSFMFAYAVFFGNNADSVILNDLTDQGQNATITNTPPPAITASRAFKTDAFYQLSVTFYDNAQRKSGIVTKTTLKTYIPDIVYTTTNFTTAINWTLDNTNALNEIPIWAVYYSINITKCLRTRFFLKLRGKNATYAGKNTDNEYTFNTLNYAVTESGCAFDISSLDSYQMGYSFTEGDIIKIYLNGSATVYFLKIIAQVGKWVVTELKDLGQLDNTHKFLFEIYTPYKQSSTESHFEVGQIFQITNYNTDSRMYGALSGTILGDVSILTRNDGTNDYLAETMSPNDKFYLQWNTDAGRPNFIETKGQKVKENSIAFSNTLIPGSKENGLSTFDALDTKDIPLETGAIQKLQLTSKVQGEQGNVMLAGCTVETASLYIGETQITDNTGETQFFSSSPSVIGTINILKGNFGTINPESWVQFRGNVWFYDANNGKWIQYSDNGLFDISSYKMTRFWNIWSKQYLSMTPEEIENLGGRPFIFTTIDPYHRELLISIPKLSNTPPKGYLPDYTNTIYPFDILDFQAKTIVYKLEMASMLPHWQGAYTFCAENFVTLQNKLYSFKNGLTWLHNQTATSYNNFYGIQYKSKIMCVSNITPNAPKVYDNMSVEANIKPTFVYLYNIYPYQQASDLVDTDFRDYEGKFCASIYRNKLVPTAIGYNIDGLLTGEKMRNVAMFIMLEFTVTAIPLELKFLNIGYTLSLGNK